MSGKLALEPEETVSRLNMAASGEWAVVVWVGTEIVVWLYAFGTVCCFKLCTHYFYKNKSSDNKVHW